MMDGVMNDGTSNRQVHGGASFQYKDHTAEVEFMADSKIAVSEKDAVHLVVGDIIQCKGWYFVQSSSPVRCFVSIQRPYCGSGVCGSFQDSRQREGESAAHR
jgi:hypothetical protein